MYNPLKLNKMLLSSTELMCFGICQSLKIINTNICYSTEVPIYIFILNSFITFAIYISFFLFILNCLNYVHKFALNMSHPSCYLLYSFVFVCVTISWWTLGAGVNLCFMHLLSFPRNLHSKWYWNAQNREMISVILVGCGCVIQLWHFSHFQVWRVCLCMCGWSTMREKTIVDLAPVASPRCT